MQNTRTCLFGGALLAAGLSAEVANAQEFVPEPYGGPGTFISYFGVSATDGASYQYSYGYAYTPAEAFSVHEAETPSGWQGRTFWEPTAAGASSTTTTAAYLGGAYAYGYMGGYFTVSEDATLRVSWDFADDPASGLISGFIFIDEVDGASLLFVDSGSSPRQGSVDVLLTEGISYRMNIDTFIFGVADTSISIDLEIVDSDPCLPDIDGDGELTIFDFLGFQNLFDSGDLAADFDGDGELTIFDFLEFQNLFDVGCG
ncbi:MAG: GC-type dockerin domain-anchored protein [Planctomycetota bacterium]